MSGPANIVTQTSNFATSSPNALSTIITSGPPTTISQAISTSQSAVATTSQPPSIVIVTSAVTNVDPNRGSTSIAPSIITLTSTASAQRAPSNTATKTVTPSSSASKSGAAALSTSNSDSTSSGGLSAGSKIAVAVVVPLAAIAILGFLALWLIRKRRQRKKAEDERKKEIEDYGFNPNHDPTLPAVGGASSNGDDGEMTQNGSAGYRGWGTTSTARKPSTTLSSGNGAIGVARSTSGSDNGRYTNGSPTGGTNKSSDGHSNDPLIGNSANGRPVTGDSETIGALGAVPSNENRQNNINRGPSNASSAYSGAHRSDTSGEGGIPGGAPGQQYYNEGMYYDEGMPQHGPYGDGSYGGAQPVIRDVPARRNTKIENPSVIPPQGSAGIAQNF